MENKPWKLEDFVDSLVVELDRTRETLSVKAVNKPLTYTVKDMSMDVNIFPTYDGDVVRFVTAQPGQQGASKVTIQLGSITDQQVRATSKPLSVTKEVSLKEANVDEDTQKELRKIGVTTVDDLQQLEKKNVDIEKVGSSKINYGQLLNQIKTTKRNSNPPKVKSVSLSVDEDNNPYIHVQGSHLAVNSKFKPVVVINNELAEVEHHDENELRIKIGQVHNISASNDLVVTLDPYAIIKLNVKA